MSLELHQEMSDWSDDMKIAMRRLLVRLNEVRHAVGCSPDLEADVNHALDVMTRDPRNQDKLGARLARADTIPVPAPCVGDDEGDSEVLLNGAIRHLPIGLDDDEPSRGDVIYAEEMRR